ncbi:MAG: putative 3-hydroxyisobutyrate dehydrogenase [Verrucomicrobiales bacterium]|nr:putative 3-hydroxyisobutyrate dehydrogenase [Verrucomicrobiales bacterium]
MNEFVGFIGIGNMGLPMAQNLLKAGYHLKVFNRTKSKLSPLLKLGAEAVDRPCDVVGPGGVVITMLSNDEALKAVMLGPYGVLKSLGPDSIHISMSTISPDTSRELAPLHRKVSAWYLASTVSGRPESAAAATLGIYLSGESAPKSRALPILQKLGRHISDCGEDPGAANVVKLAANFMLFSVIESFAEALAFTEKQKLDRTAVMNMLCDNLFDCAVFRNYGRLLATKEYEHAAFKVELAFKDLRLALKSGESVAMPMPFADSLHNRFLNLLATGKADWDVCAIGRGVDEQAGLA